MGVVTGWVRFPTHFLLTFHTVSALFSADFALNSPFSTQNSSLLLQNSSFLTQNSSWSIYV